MVEGSHQQGRNSDREDGVEEKEKVGALCKSYTKRPFP
jgi:hypothetical protein